MAIKLRIKLYVQINYTNSVTYARPKKNREWNKRTIKIRIKLSVQINCIDSVTDARQHL